jgi:hypothetical protein
MAVFSSGQRRFAARNPEPAPSCRVVHQWVGPGGDSLAIGSDAIWLTDYHKGTIARLRITDATSR